MVDNRVSLYSAILAASEIGIGSLRSNLNGGLQKLITSKKTSRTEFEQISDLRILNSFIAEGLQRAEFQSY